MKQTKTIFKRQTDFLYIFPFKVGVSTCRMWILSLVYSKRLFYKFCTCSIYPRGSNTTVVFCTNNMKIIVKGTKICIALTNYDWFFLKQYLNFAASTSGKSTFRCPLDRWIGPNCIKFKASNVNLLHACPLVWVLLCPIFKQSTSQCYFLILTSLVPRTSQILSKDIPSVKLMYQPSS